jgi:filamentous hemagglutinin family protein
MSGFNALKRSLYTSVAVMAIVVSGAASAGPVGGVVVGGSASITQSELKTDIYQSSSKAILDWRSFDIGASEHVQFHQPSSSAIALNRIRDVKPSRIDGRLTANGHVMLLNPNGVVFGSGSQVDVGSLTVTTADIDNNDFMAGRLTFNKAGMHDAAIVNKGTITVQEAGLASFVAPHVVNDGVISARLGKVQLAAADTFTLDLAGDQLLQVAVSHEDATKLASNSGILSAEGGYVALTATKARHVVNSLVSNTGIIEAQSMTQVGGKIILGGGNAGMTSNTGILNASGRTHNAQGGEIAVLGAHINIGAGSIIDASGTSSVPVPTGKPDTATMSADKQVKTNELFLNSLYRGGGSILIGGDYLGTGDAPRAQTLYVDANALTLNDALTHGDGGRTIFWSDDTTDYSGLTLARGGVLSGNGGFVETSGKINLRALGSGRVDLTSNNNSRGLWLLDPATITILDRGQASDLINTFTSLDLENASIGADIALLADNTLTLNLQGDTVTLANDSNLSLTATNNDITSTSAGTIVTNRTTTGGNIDFNAGRNITLSNITVNSQGGDLTLNADTDAVGGGLIGLTNTIINTSGGDFTAGGGANPLTTAAIGVAAGNDGVTLSNSRISTAAGNISIRGEGFSDAGTNNQYGVYIHNSSTLTTSSGDIDVWGEAGSGNDANYGIYIRNMGSLISTTDGKISIIGEGGSNGLAGSNSNIGVYLGNEAIINSVGTGVNAGTIIINGTGGSGEDDNHGVYIRDANTAINTADGAISITGMGGSNGLAGSNVNIGVYLGNEAIINSAGTEVNAGTITINGTGGAGEDNNYGVYFRDANTAINTDDGALTITGIAKSDGTGDSDNNIGFFIERSATINSTGTGVNAGTITINGTGGAGEDTNFGVYVSSTSAEINTADGALTITGIGGSNGSAGSNDNYGLYLRGQSKIVSTGLGVNAGTITLSGTGGNGEDNNRGIYATEANTLIQAIDGAIKLTGTGGSSGLVDSDDNYGIYLSNGFAIKSTGLGVNAGTITFNGIGGDSEDNNLGVYINSSNTSVSAVDGYISISGTGGLSARGVNNSGLEIRNGADVISKNNADITLTATRGAGTTTDFVTANGTTDIGESLGDNMLGDIILNFDTAALASASIKTDGDIIITPRSASASIGLGGGSGTLNLTDTELGFFNAGGKFVIGDSINGTGDVDVNSWNLSSTAYDVELYGNDIDLGGVTVGTGSILVDTSDDGADLGSLNISGDITGSASEVTIITDNYNSTATSINALGNLNIRTNNNLISIGLGGGAGDLNLSDAELAQFTVGGDFIVGSATAGLISVDSVDFTAITNNNVSLLGSGLTLDNNMDVGNGLTVLTDGSITLNGSISATGGGNSVVLKGSSFDNNAGVSAIDAGTGRWLVYTNNGSDVSAGGLMQDTNLYNRSYAANAPVSIDNAFGDSFVYSYQPTITIKADDIMLDSYSPDFDSFTYSISGLENGDITTQAFAGSPILSVDSLDPGGIFSIASVLGSLTSAVGYSFDFVSGTLEMPTKPVPTTITRLSSTVEQTIQMPKIIQQNNDYVVITLNNTTSGSGTSSSEPDGSGSQPRLTLRKKSQMNNADSSEPKADVRLVQANLLEIEQPVIDFYDLCSYNVTYCE